MIIRAVMTRSTRPLILSGALPSTSLPTLLLPRRLRPSPRPVEDSLQGRWSGGETLGHSDGREESASRDGTGRDVDRVSSSRGTLSGTSGEEGLPHGEVTSDLAWPMGGPEGCAPCPLVVTVARQPGPTPMLRVRHRSQCRPTGDGGIFRAGCQVGAPQSPSGPRPAIESGSSDGAHHRSERCLRARRACGRRISAASWPRGTSRCSP